jgi:hypothetical protein
MPEAHSLSSPAVTRKYFQSFSGGPVRQGSAAPLYLLDKWKFLTGIYLEGFNTLDEAWNETTDLRNRIAAVFNILDTRPGSVCERRF